MVCFPDKTMKGRMPGILPQNIIVGDILLFRFPVTNETKNGGIEMAKKKISKATPVNGAGAELVVRYTS